MKKIFFTLASLLILLGGAQSAFAAHTMCSTDFRDDDKFVGTREKVTMTCDDDLSLEINGVGVGFKSAMLSGVTVECPLQEELQGRTYYGIKAGVGVILGLDVALFGSKNGVCFFIGGGISSFGAGISGMSISFK